MPRGIAKDGLGYLHSTMEFCRGEESMPLKQAMDKFKERGN